jgi:ATP phosphoribosyltransferase
MNAHQMVIAIPNKGRLKEQVLCFLKGIGYPVAAPKGNRLQTFIEGKEQCKVVFMHAKDIAYMLDEGIVDVGITGLDLIAETRVQVRTVAKLGIGKVKMCLLVPEDSKWSHPFHLLNKTIATPFPSLTKSYFDRLKVPANIRPILGASEGFPYLGIADAIVDIVETGSTARDNGLRVLCDDLFDSECVCAVKRPEFQANHILIHEFLRGVYG